MTTTQAIGVAATCSGVCFSLAPLLQARTVLRARDSGEVSLTWVAVIIVNSILWAAYGFAKANLPLIISNVIAVTTNTLTWFVIFRFRRRPGARS